MSNFFILQIIPRFWGEGKLPENKVHFHLLPPPQPPEGTKEWVFPAHLSFSVSWGGWLREEYLFSRVFFQLEKSLFQKIFIPATAYENLQLYNY